MKKKIWKGFRRPGRAWILTGLLILLAAALTGLNILLTSREKKEGWRADYSFNSITTQSETTRKVLADLKDPVHIYAMFRKGQEDAPLMELLDRYAAESEMITWEQTDPSLNPALLTRFAGGTENVTADSIIVYCEKTNRWRILSPDEFVSLSMDEETGAYSYAGFTYERALTGAILYTVRAEIPRIVILQGHGELDGETVKAFDDLMTENQYEVVYRELADTEYTPDPKELLVFFSPMRDLTEEETKKVLAFAEKGGSLLFTCDYTDPIGEMPNYATVLRLYGFIPREGIVIADKEDPNSYYSNMRIDLIPTMRSTDVTMDLLASGADTVLMPGCRAFETPGETDRNLVLFPVLESGKTAYLKKITRDISSIEKSEEDETGPFVLALQAQRMTSEGYVSRAFISGSSGMMTESQIYAITDVQQLMIRMMEYLTNQPGSNLDIMAKNAIRPGLSAKGNGLGSVVISILPLSILLAALIVLGRRRNR